LTARGFVILFSISPDERQIVIRLIAHGREDIPALKARRDLP